MRDVEHCARSYWLQSERTSVQTRRNGHKALAQRIISASLTSCGQALLQSVELDCGAVEQYHGITTSIRSRSSSNCDRPLADCVDRPQPPGARGFVVATQSPCATLRKSTFRVSIRRSADSIASVPRKTCIGTRHYALHIHLHVIHTACREYGYRGRMHIMVSCVTMGAL